MKILGRAFKEEAAGVGRDLKASEKGIARETKAVVCAPSILLGGRVEKKQRETQDHREGICKKGPRTFH